MDEMNGAGALLCVAPQIRGFAGPRDLISAIGTVLLRVDYPGPESDISRILFRVATCDYWLELGFTETHFYMLRNNSRLEVPLEIGRLICFANWEPAQLKLAVLDAVPNVDQMEAQMLAKTRVLETSPTIPPYSLIEWARRRAIVEATTYDSADQLNAAVIASLQSIPDKVQALGIQNSFWDKIYQGRKLVSMSPKHEADIQPLIHGLLHDICLAKSIRVTREYPVAGGKLDFLFSGALTSGKNVNVCVEFKHAHNDKLVSGLVKQLPTYMQGVGSDFGVYCVMWFRGSQFSEPHQYDDSNALKVFLDTQKFSEGLTNIRVLVMDFSHHESPSRL